MSRVLLLAVAFFLVPLTAMVEGRCPPGQYPVGSEQGGRWVVLQSLEGLRGPVKHLRLYQLGSGKPVGVRSLKIGSLSRAVRCLLGL